MKIIETIIDLLNISAKDGISFRGLCKKLSITAYSDKETLQSVLDNLERESIIIEYNGKLLIKIDVHQGLFPLSCKDDTELLRLYQHGLLIRCYVLMK